MRRPSLQFYPADWQANPKLRRCSHAEKGIWLDVLCILHDQDEYGVVRWLLRDLAQAIRARPAALQGLVDKGVLKGADSGECQPLVFVPRHSRKDGEPVTLIESQPGPIWYSSRMVRDEYVRQARADNEPKPAPKVAPKPAPKQAIDTTQGSHPSRAHVSSSSSSSSSTASSKEDKSPSAFAELLKFLELKIGPIPNPGKEGKAIKWLLENGYDPEQCKACYYDLAAQDWRTTTVDWVTVKSNIGAWVSRQPVPRKPTVTTVSLPRPPGVCDWRCVCGFSMLQNGNGITKCPDCGKDLKPDGLVSVGSRKTQG